MFLTDEDLIELTNYKVRRFQRAWLKANGIKYKKHTNGRPVVLWSEVNSVMQSNPITTAVTEIEPDYQAAYSL